ncbi:hypothetical protein ACHAXR_009716 [Thalassiosira sp. AJA248-18]
MRSFLPILSAIALSTPSSHAFHAPCAGHSICARHQLSRTSISLTNEPIQNESRDADATIIRRPKLEQSIASSLAAVSILLGAATSACAVSGGGLDYAGLDISGQDFSNRNFKGKDFTQVLAKATTFANSNLQGCRFYNSFLPESNFEGADVRGASFERNNMDNANLRNVNAGGAYFGDSLLDVKSMEGADFTDASIPPKLLNSICEREDVKGTNPDTGVDTRDSLMCL